MKGKTENEFNAFLSSEFKKLAPQLEAIKIADKFKSGLSDFLLWYDGASCALEVKFVKELPVRNDSMVLDHKFSGAQIRKMTRLVETGNRAMGVVAVKSLDLMFFIPFEILSELEEGNISKEQLLSCISTPPTAHGIMSLVLHAFGME